MKRRAACYTNGQSHSFSNNPVEFRMEGSKKLRKKSVPAETVQVVRTDPQSGE